MSQFGKKLALFFLALSLGTAPLSAMAQTDDPESRVGRISYVSGDVGQRTIEDETWAEAVLNYPVTSGNTFQTNDNGRVELRIGDDSIRLDTVTTLEIQGLNDQTTRLYLSEGTANVHVGALRSDEIYQIETPRGPVDLLEAGSYRIDAGAQDEPTAVAVFEGQARFSNQSLTVGAGQTLLATGLDQVSYRVQPSTLTAFDNWSLARDSETARRDVTRYVSPEMTGYEDLGAYGSWKTVPTYGAVWVPTAVPVGWEPYRHGHWAWVKPWGWTWIDDAPWGFAPFHYGRWIHHDRHWVWWPGHRVAKPVFAPALVVFIGGNGWSVGFSSGNPAVGWFPLGPGEIYHPAYHASDRYFRDINRNVVRHEDDIQRARRDEARHYAHRSFATVVSQNDFVSKRPVSRALVTVPRARLEKAPLHGNTPPVPRAQPAHSHEETTVISHSSEIPSRPTGATTQQPERREPVRTPSSSVPAETVVVSPTAPSTQQAPRFTYRRGTRHDEPTAKPADLAPKAASTPATQPTSRFSHQRTDDRQTHSQERAPTISTQSPTTTRSVTPPTATRQPAIQPQRQEVTPAVRKIETRPQTPTAPVQTIAPVVTQQPQTTPPTSQTKTISPAPSAREAVPKRTQRDDRDPDKDKGNIRPLGR